MTLCNGIIFVMGVDATFGYNGRGRVERMHIYLDQQLGKLREICFNTSVVLEVGFDLG